MENATKGLLLAAAILIAIILIAVPLRILTSTKRVAEEVGESTVDLETSVYNSQFTKYAGNKKSASDVRALLSTIQQLKSGNKIKGKLLINFQQVGNQLYSYVFNDNDPDNTSAINPNIINDILALVSSNKKYEISVETGFEASNVNGDSSHDPRYENYIYRIMIKPK